VSDGRGAVDARARVGRASSLGSRRPSTSSPKRGLGSLPAYFYVGPAGAGVIWSAVIPAKAGIYSASHWKSTADGLDSRFRGNDQCFERDPIPNDTTTAQRVDVLTESS
jgi:hypothetical protein